MSVHLKLGDCLVLLAQLPDNCMDSIVTDPPYGLKFMGKHWDHDVPSQAIWEQCLRVLKPGGHLLAFAGTRTQHRMACRIEDAGFEIRDMITWNYGSGFPKSQNISKAIDKAAGAEREVISEVKTKSGGMGHVNKANAEQGYRPSEYNGHSLDDEAKNVIQQTLPATEKAKRWDGWGTALKPSIEPITVARKPLSEKTIAANVLKYGTGALNIDGCRVATEDSLNGGRSTGSCKATDDNWNRPYMNDEAYLANMAKESKERTVKAEALGRWPANFIHDGSDEVVALFPDSKGQQGDVKGTEPSRTGDKNTHCYGEYGRIPASKRGDTGSAVRFFYCAKASKKDREGSNHPTMKPTDLMRYLCRLVTQPNGIVLDPFMGSGSTGKAAVLEGFSFVGIEVNEAYFNIAKSRIKND
jgi:DNA modification methylase